VVPPAVDAKMMPMDSESGDAADRLKRVTIVDVARHAGVSTAAVSKVLRDAYGVSEGMRARVQNAIGELGYRPHRLARGMRGRTFTIGMVVTDIENSFFNLLSDGAGAVFAEQDYELFIAPSGFSPAGQVRAINALIDHQMDGLILVAPLVPQAEVDRFARQVPVVVVGRHGESPLFDGVAGDDRRGAELVVDHLLALGHEQIAFLENSLMPPDPHRPESVRLAGFLEAMRAHGLADRATVVDGVWSIDGGRDAARRIEALASRPTAVHAGADVAAFGMLGAWWEDGIRVPGDFSLVGYDNSRMASVGPLSLTTVDQSGNAMGARAARLLLDRVGGRAGSVHELIEPRLIERATTRPRR
jgi:LacI family transcriptional regulator